MHASAYVSGSDSASAFDSCLNGAQPTQICAYKLTICQEIILTKLNIQYFVK